MPFRPGSYLLRVARHVEPRFYILLEELENTGTDEKFLDGLDRLTADISQGEDPYESEPLPGLPGFWAATVEGVRLNFSVDEDGEWVVIELLPRVPDLPPAGA